MIYRPIPGSHDGRYRQCVERLVQDNGKKCGEPQRSERMSYVCRFGLNAGRQCDSIDKGMNRQSKEKPGPTKPVNRRFFQRFSMRMAG